MTKYPLLIQHIASTVQDTIVSIKTISGGDVSEAFLLQGKKQAYFLKTNTDKQALKLFEAEKDGLGLIGRSNTISVPLVLSCQKVDQRAYLLLEYIPNKAANPSNFRLLGEQLAQLHRQTQGTFGGTASNWIGRLKQSNTPHANWPSFYVQERIWPQLQLALKKGYFKQSEIPDKDRLLTRCKAVLGHPRPSLLHGDLWRGNYLMTPAGQAYLIDPAAYRGHHLVDIAMTRLFGGFDRSFYEAYEYHFPKLDNYDACIDIYQLYYLLVHLNMFGPSYYKAVQKTIQYYWRQ